MSVVDKIRDGGWGSLFLFLNSLAILYLLFPDMNRAAVVAAAAAPSLILIFLVSTFNDGLMKIFAGETIRDTFSEIDERTGDDEEFYWDQNTDTRDSIDDLDMRAHQKLVMIFSGIIIAVANPVVAWYLDARLQVIAGILVFSVVILYLLCYKPFYDLQEVIKSSLKIYGANDED